MMLFQQQQITHLQEQKNEPSYLQKILYNLSLIYLKYPMYNIYVLLQFL